jgi:putative ATP-dependent endonuclease of OLD family
VAQLTYLYYPDKRIDLDNDVPSPGIGEESESPTTLDEDDYKWTIYPKDEANETFSFRGMWNDMPMRYINALRDMARDNRVWQRSPLNQLVKLSDLTSGQLEEYADEIAETSASIVSDQVSLTNLECEIQDRLLEMVGKVHNVDPQLGLDVTTPEALLRSLRLFIDGLRGRPMDRTSLGLQNAIYLALLSLELDKKTAKRGSQKKPYIPMVALEEPEAHLHPHLQRLVFEDFLSRAKKRRQPVIISSHSPHLVSIADVDDLVLLKENGAEGSKAYSAYEYLQALGERERKDLARFLDITKAEMLFARGSLFVEGDVELILLNTFAGLLDLSLDQYGISIMAHIGSVVKPGISRERRQSRVTVSKL